MVTCQGRDHLVSIRSRCRSLVVVDVHFEPELTLRSLRERLRPIILLWPPCPEALRVSTGDFIIFEPEEGRWIVWNQSCTERDMGKCALFHYFSSCLWSWSARLFTRRDSTTDGTTRTLSRIDRAFINLPYGWSTRFPLLFSCVWESWKTVHVTWPFSSTCRHAETRLLGGHQGKRISSWMSKHSFAAQSCNSSVTNTNTLKVFLAQALTFVCQPFCETLAVDIAMSHVERAHGAAQRRRDRMVRCGDTSKEVSQLRLRPCCTTRLVRNLTAPCSMLPLRWVSSTSPWPTTRPLIPIL